MNVNRDTIIGDILDFDETTSQYFVEMGMHCLGCPSARGETISEACDVHEVDVEILISKLKNHFGN